jgi:thiamine monophosphate synthase
MKTAGIYGFYPVVDDVRWLRRFAAGCAHDPVADQGQSATEVRRQIREALAVAADYPDCQLIINDYWRDRD